MITRATNEHPITPNVILQNRRGEKLGVIENVTNLVRTVNMSSADEISFSVYKYEDGKQCRLWDEVHDFRLVYIPDFHESFEIDVSLEESTDVVKRVTGTQFQYAELSQINLYDVQINTEDDIERDDYDANYPTVFYRDDPAHKDASLLHRILADKASHYQIYHVDDSLKNITRAFTFNGKDVLSALNEIAEQDDCLFIFGQTDDPYDGKLHRTISAYDLEDHCNVCGQRGMFKDKCTKCGSTDITRGYGQDTGIYVSKDNIAETVNYETNAGQVKNCFKLKAGDDLMTATVRNCNPNGSNYIWYFTDRTKADMSEDLSAALTKYDKQYSDIYNSKQMDISQSAVDNYNSIVGKYKDYSKENGKQHEPISYPINGYGAMISASYNAMDLYGYLQNTMMPGSSTVQETTAEKEAAKLTSDTLSPIGVEKTSVLTRVTQDNAVLAYAKVLYDFSKYNVTVKSSRMVTTEAWEGILSLKSYTDSKDVADTQLIYITFNNDALTFTKQKIEKAMKSKQAYAISAPQVIKLEYDDFVSHVHNRYGLNPLKVFESCLQSAVDVLTQQGCGQDYGDDRNFHSIYTEYVRKLNYIRSEEGERQNQIDQIAVYDSGNLVGGLLSEIESQRLSVRQHLDTKKYLDKIDTTLWEELSSFRRQQEYSNGNYISTNLSNAQMVKNAQDFLKKATLELIKSATLQHSISGSLYDLLIMPEFDGLLDNFNVGNWIRLGVDGSVYKLRLKSYTIDYNAVNIQRISVTFSDVINGFGTVDDLKSIFDSAKSVATSYDAVMHKADKGNKANSQIQNFVSNGLELTNSKISSDSNQSITYDKHGILLRRKDDLTNSYAPQQLKIINNGMYYTTDNWTTVKSAFGAFQYKDPADGFKEKTGYGVIANHLVGNLILGNNLGIYNESGSFSFTDDGADFNTTSKFTIRNGDTKLFWIDSQQKTLNINGQCIVNGSIGTEALSDSYKNAVKEYAHSAVVEQVGDIDSQLNTINAQISSLNSTSDNLKTNKNRAVYSTSDPSSSDNGYQKGDLWFNSALGKLWMFTDSKWELQGIGNESIKDGSITSEKIKQKTLDSINVTNSVFQTKWMSVTANGETVYVRSRIDPNIPGILFDQYTGSSPSEDTTPSSTYIYGYAPNSSGEWSPYFGQYKGGIAREDGTKITTS